uniref:Uncharacterized protein n=1 Tax=Avena sativa TaxID=4498 RepID=A0ACD5WXX8_AVESA
MAAGEGVGRCILVGLHMDAAGKDILQWALNQAARSGDRVVAVHIYRKSGDLCKTNALTLIRTLDEYLAEYEAICSEKDVVLVGRVTPGSSIQKVLVKEAKLCAAMMVVIGTNKKYSFGGSTCLAKYCARKLPPTTSVVAIQSGKAIFVREAPKPPLGAEPKPVLRTLLHPSVGMEPKVIIPNPNRSARSVDLDAPSCGQCAAPPAKPYDDDKAPAAVEHRLGWPLLRRSPAGAGAQAQPGQELRKQSVVHWVMSLPRRSSPSSSPEPPLEGLAADLKRLLAGVPSRCRWFRYEELYDSTNHFSPENLVGKGGHSRVYRGSLASGQQVAIKLCRASKEASKDFLREVDILTKLQHDRIVPLSGVCVEGRNLVSVYRYLPRGSLEDNLHGKKKSKPTLPWEKRYRAAVGVAEALSYVHSGSSRPVIHRDVKSSNILLTDDFEPQLSDFGLAIWAPSSPSSLTHSDVVGTFGYLAPEYFMYGKVTDKVDVYAFGVVLLELLTGRKPISGDGSPKGQESLVMWATPILNGGDVSDLLDPSLDVRHDEVEVRRMALAASLCLGRSARLRPRISQVLSILRGEEDTASATFAAAEPDSVVDDETYPTANVRSHLGLALLDVEDTESISSTEHSNLSPLEEYLRQRCSRSSSFD